MSRNVPTVAERFEITKDEIPDWLGSVTKLFGTKLRQWREANYKNSGNDPRYSREFVAEQMRAYGFSSWRGTTLAKVEYSERELKLNEAIALCEILDQDLLELVKPYWHDTEAGRAHMVEFAKRADRLLAERRQQREADRGEHQ